MLRGAHALDAAGDDDGAFAGADLLGAEGDGAQAGAADLVDAEGGRLIGDARGAGGLASRVLALAGGEDLAENDLVDVRRIDPGGGDCGLHGGGAEHVGGHGGEGAVEAADRRTHGGDDDDVVPGWVLHVWLSCDALVRLAAEDSADVAGAKAAPMECQSNVVCGDV
jgi:hypothetical protein